MKEQSDTALEDLKNKKITLLLTSHQKRDFLKEIGFDIDEEGYIIDPKTKERVKTKEGRPINVFEDKSFGLIGGSIEFFKDIVDYSRILTERNRVKVVARE